MFKCAGCAQAKLTFPDVIIGVAFHQTTTNMADHPDLGRSIDDMYKVELTAYMAELKSAKNAMESHREELEVLECLEAVQEGRGVSGEYHIFAFRSLHSDSKKAPVRTYRDT